MPSVLTDLYNAYKDERNSDNCRPDILKQLKDKLLSVIAEENINNIIDEEKGENLLHSAIFDRDNELVEWLLNNNAKVDIANKQQLTPMRIATNILFFEGAEFLHRKGISVDEPDTLGETCLFSAVRRGAYKHVNILLGLDANVFANSNYGETIIDCIAFLLENNMVPDENKFKVIRLLLENYIGIGTSWDGIDLPPEVVNGIPMIFATKNGQPISKDMPSFAGVIDSIEGLLQSKTLDFKKLQSVLEKAFSPFFPNGESGEIHRMISKEHGLIRETQFEKAGPELEKLYKTLRIRTAGVSSLRELASTALMLKHGLKAEKNPPSTADVKSTPPTEAQKLTGKEINNPPVQPSGAALLIKQGLHAEKIPQSDVALNSPSDSQNLGHPRVQASENMKLVADAILDPEKLALMPTDLVEYIEKIGANLADKLPSEISKRSTKKGDPT